LLSLRGVLLAGATVIAVAGCGGSSSSSSTDASASFSTQAEAICTQVNSQVATLPAITSTANLLTTGQQEVTLSKAALGKLTALTPPAAKKAGFDAYVSGITQETGILQQALAAIKAGDKAKTQQLATQSKALDSADQTKAKALGLTACTANAQPGSAKSTSSSS
jgi:hypothetical protein